MDGDGIAMWLKITQGTSETSSSPKNQPKTPKHKSYQAPICDVEAGRGEMTNPARMVDVGVREARGYYPDQRPLSPLP